MRELLLTLLNLPALVGVLFAMAAFFLIAGSFAPPSLERKGLRRFLIDRTVRLGVPLVFVLLALAPVVEYVDVGDNADWGEGFPAFVLYIWRHPAPGPLWFLEVLLLFSFTYAVVRTVFPSRRTGPTPMLARYLLVAGVFVAITSCVIRIVVAFGEEVGQDL